MSGRQRCKNFPFVLRSYVTGNVRDLRNGDVIYVTSSEQVEAIENALEVYEVLHVRYPTPYGYELRLEEEA